MSEDVKQLTVNAGWGPMPKGAVALDANRVRLSEIKKAVCKRFAITEQEINSPRRARWCARPRMLAMTLTRELTLHSLPSIGKSYGGRDHSTVWHAMKAIQRLRGDFPEWDDHYIALKTSLTYQMPANDGDTQ